MQIEGRNPVVETLRSDTKATILFMQMGIGKSPKVSEIISLAQKKGVRIRKVSKNQLKKLSNTKNHQGVILRVYKPEIKLKDVLAEIDKKRIVPFFVLLNEVLYQQNLGAIIRSAECAGAHGVIIPRKTKVTPEAIRASMGATEHIPVIRESIFNAIRMLKDRGIKIVGIEATGDTYIYDSDLTGAITIIVGGEDSGITDALLQKCDEVLKIPLLGKVNSLNMSNAAAIIFFEKVRQEMGKP